MGPGAFFLVLALLILVGLFVSRPFLESQADFTSEISTALEASERHALLAERDSILNALKELDFDHALGKIPREDYPHQRASLMQRGAVILRKLDEIHSTDFDEGVEDRSEAAIAERHANQKRSQDIGEDQALLESTMKSAPVRGVSASIADPDDNLEVMLAKRRRAHQEKAAGFCPKCGGPTKKSDRFCPKCGAKLV